MAKAANIMGVTPANIANVMGVTSLNNTEILGIKIAEPVWSGSRMVMVHGEGESTGNESAYKSFSSDADAADWIDNYHDGRTDMMGCVGNGVHLISGGGVQASNAQSHANSRSLEVRSFANTSGTAALTGGSIAESDGKQNASGASNGTLGFIWGGYMGSSGNDAGSEYFTIATNADCTDGPGYDQSGYGGSGHGCSNGDTYALIAMGTSAAEGRVMRHNFNTSSSAETNTNGNGHVWGLPDPDGIGPEGSGYGPRSHVDIMGPSCAEGDSSRVVMWAADVTGPHWAYANYAQYWPQDMIWYMNPNSNGEASDFGNQDECRFYSSSSSDKTRAELWGGTAQNTFADQTRESSPSTTTDMMEKITVASTGNGSEYGDIPFNDNNNVRNQTSSGN